MQTWYVNWRTTTGEHTGGSKQCQATFVAAKADPHMQIPSLPLEDPEIFTEFSHSKHLPQQL
jgi:hypothetical protein